MNAADLMEMENLVNELFADLIPKSPNRRYYPHPRKLFQYSWNTEPLTPSENTQNKRWAAMIYKSKGKGQFALVKVRYFSKRKTAKNQALRWYKAAKARLEMK